MRHRVGVVLPHRRLRVIQARRTPRRAGGRLPVDQVLEFGVDAGPVQVGSAHLDTVPAGVGDQ
jgi:hypothetical protein